MEVNNKVMDSSQNKIEQQSNKEDWSNYSYEQITKMIEQTRLNCQKTIESCSNSIQTIGESLKTIGNARKSIDSFYDQFDKAMNNLCNKIADSFQEKSLAFKKNENTNIYEDSKESTIEECVKLFQGKKKIVFLTGAGISYASGIPTFRGVGASPLFEKDGVVYQNEEISTYSFFKNKPDLFWERNLQLLRGMVGKKPNISHINIQKLVNYYREQNQNKNDGTEAIIITQNTDGLHCQAFNELNPNNTSYLNEDNVNYGFCPDVFEVHGTESYLRCDNQSCSVYDKRFKFPKNFNTYKDLICQKCKVQARPHTLYFDESYDQKNYRIQTLKDILKEMDLLICIGTQLETGFAASAVSNAVKEKIPIIEICLTPVIEKGGITLKGKAEEIIPKLCEKLMNLNNQSVVEKNIDQISNNKISEKSLTQVNVQRKSVSSTTSSVSTKSSLSNISNKVLTVSKVVSPKTSTTAKSKINVDLTNKKTIAIQNKPKQSFPTKIVKK